MAIQALTSDLRIGEWTVEPALNQLSAPGRAVKVEPKAMEVLAYLAERAGKVASREELLDAVWRGAVVGDDALTQVVIKLRKALGDSYIETIPKRGYRLDRPGLPAGTRRRRQRSGHAGCGWLGSVSSRSPPRRSACCPGWVAPKKPARSAQRPCPAHHQRAPL